MIRRLLAVVAFTVLSAVGLSAALMPPAHALDVATVPAAGTDSLLCIGGDRDGGVFNQCIDTRITKAVAVRLPV